MTSSPFMCIFPFLVKFFVLLAWRGVSLAGMEGIPDDMML